jgi:hypothetical protein
MQKFWLSPDFHTTCCDVGHTFDNIALRAAGAAAAAAAAVAVTTPLQETVLNMCLAKSSTTTSFLLFCITPIRDTNDRTQIWPKQSMLNQRSAHLSIRSWSPSGARLANLTRPPHVVLPCSPQLTWQAAAVEYMHHGKD